MVYVHVQFYYQLCASKSSYIRGTLPQVDINLFTCESGLSHRSICLLTHINLFTCEYSTGVYRLTGGRGAGAAAAAEGAAASAGTTAGKKKGGKKKKGKKGRQ